jgi:hypothetical protein
MSSSPSRLSRRTLFAGAGTAGALAVAASALPGAKQVASAPVAKPMPKPTRGGGYALSEHVQHYYKTVKV